MLRSLLLLLLLGAAADTCPSTGGAMLQCASVSTVASLAAANLCGASGDQPIDLRGTL